MAGYDKRYGIDNSFNHVLLPGVSLCFWAAGYWVAAGYPAHGGKLASPLWETVCRTLPSQAATYLAGLLLLVAGALLIHRANYVLGIIREKTLMPLFLFVFLVSVTPGFSPLHPASLSVFCLIAAFFQLFAGYHDPKSTRKIFNTTLFIGLGSLLWIHVLWILPVFWWGMYHLQAWNRQTLPASLVGVGTVYWFLLAWCVRQHDFELLRRSFALFPTIGVYDVFADSRLADWLHLLCIAGFTAIASINILMHELAADLRLRRFMAFLVVLAGALLCMSLFYDGFLSLACVPISILLAQFFTSNRGKKRFRLFYIFIFLDILISLMRYLPWTS
jgi:hypothetical protein